MATFNVDSLDFSDDEEVRVGSNDDYGFSYDSGNDALEIEDRVNTAIASIPRGTSTDLVGGKFAETVSEGKALADDGNVYDSIQGAVDSASSWVKVGPGTFNESVTIDTAGLTLVGSGERTVINGGSSAGVTLNASDVELHSVSVKSNYPNGLEAVIINEPRATVTNVVATGGSRATIRIQDTATDCLISNCVAKLGSLGISVKRGVDRQIIINCRVTESDDDGIQILGDESIVSNCVVENTGNDGILAEDDSIVYGNIVKNTTNYGIIVAELDAIIAKNRLINTDGINDTGTGNITDSNLITE